MERSTRCRSGFGEPEVNAIVCLLAADLTCRRNRLLQVSRVRLRRDFLYPSGSLNRLRRGRAFAPRCSLCCRIRELTSVNRKTAARLSLRSVVLSGGRCLYLPFLTLFHQSPIRQGRWRRAAAPRAAEWQTERRLSSTPASVPKENSAPVTVSAAVRPAMLRRNVAVWLMNGLWRAVPSDGTVGVSINPAWSRWSDDE